MRRSGFSMVELVTTIVLMGILSGGTYISLSKLYTKKSKAKATSELSFDSARIANQISILLSFRIPATVIGYDMSNGTFESIYTMSQEYGVLEWISQDFENYRAKNYSGFIDFELCDANTNMLFSPDTNISKIPDAALIFAGSFDVGDVGYGSDFSESFGWHKHNASQLFTINNASKDENLTLDTKPNTIYEKYYLASSAFSIARAEDVNATCRESLDTKDNTLLLYYNYRPWLGETFCDDANVTILSNEVSGFEVDFINGNLQFNLTLEREIRKPGKNIIVKISKEKVVF